MFGGNKNIKDIQKDSSVGPTAHLKDNTLVITYTKTNKLITALYMVTDIIDKDEPIRNKLRTLGAGIISDMNTMPSNVCSKISEIMSFLDIALSVNIISFMNFSILEKEFLELNQSILSTLANKEAAYSIKRQINLSEFFTETKAEKLSQGHFQTFSIPRSSNGHTSPTHIGVQKGSTLMKALNNIDILNTKKSGGIVSDILKKQRREDIINIVKNISGGATIKDIKDRAQASSEKMVSLISCSEKTLQRELISMVKDTVLNKTGEKRWSKYFLK